MTLNYHDGSAERRREDRSVPTRPEEDTFVPPVDREAIFLELIRGEVHRGRLHKTARARIVGYATGMGLSALQAGKLIERCMRENAQASTRFRVSPVARFVPADNRGHRMTGLLTCALILLTAAIIGLLNAG